MGNPYTSVSVSNYNSNPPSDDGSQTAANRLQWSTHKSKLGDPLKTAIDSINTNTNAAFAKVIGGAGVVATATDYTVGASDQGKLVKVTASATVTTPDATSVGSPFVFHVLNLYSGDITLDGSGSQTVDGHSTITIPTGCGVFVSTDGTNWFTSGQNYSRALVPAQGRLTLVSGTPVMTSDQTAKTAIYFTPYKGNLVPIPDGSTYSVQEFSELTLTLNGTNYTADTLFDVFVSLDPADGITQIIGSGPAWSTTTAGSSARGSGAGTTELTALKGLQVNKNAITLRNDTTTYSIAAEAALFVGTFYVDHTAGQVSCHTAYGQNRKWGLWNEYNRELVILKAGDSTASWTYATATLRASNNAPSSWTSPKFNVGSGTSCNGMTLLAGRQEGRYDLIFTQKNVYGVSITPHTLGIGINATDTASGRRGSNTDSSGSCTEFSAEYETPAALGLTTVVGLEIGPGSATNTFYGTETDMILAARFFA